MSDEADELKRQLAELPQRGSREIVESWRARGRDFVSIVDGCPTPWDRMPLKDIMASAKQRRLEVLCLADPSHVEIVIAAMLAYLALHLGKPFRVDMSIN